MATVKDDDAGAAPERGDRRRIAGWEVDPATGRLARDGEEIRLEPKVMDVLVYLSGRRGQVVSREELEAAVWAGRVVSYDAVTNAIIKLRRAFGDDSRHPRVIETLSKKGYRLIAEVEPVRDAPSEPALREGRDAGRGCLYRSKAPAYAVAVLLAAALAAWWLHRGAGPDPVDASAKGAPIVVLPFENLGPIPRRITSATVSRRISSPSSPSSLSSPSSRAGPPSRTGAPTVSSRCAASSACATCCGAVCAATAPACA